MGNHDVDPALKQRSAIVTRYYTYISCDLKNNVQYRKQYNSSISRRTTHLQDIDNKTIWVISPGNVQMAS